MPIKSLKVDGHSEQKTRDEKNKFNLDYIRNAPAVFTITKKGVNLNNCHVTDVFNMNSQELLSTFKTNTTYTMRVKAKVVSRPSTILFIQEGTFLLYKDGGSVSIPILNMQDKESIALNTEKTYVTTFTTPADMTDVRFLAYTFYGNNDGSTTGTPQGEIDLSEIMLVEGSYTAENFPDFELYGASPTPPYPSPIKSVGESWNKFDGEFELGNINSSGNSEHNNTIRTKNYISVEENNVYSIFTKDLLLSNSNTQIFFYDKNNNYISDIWRTTFTTPVNCKFIRFKILGQSNINTKVQLVEGTEEKPYRAYGYNLFVEKSGKNKLDISKAYDFSSGATTTTQIENGLNVKGIWGVAFPLKYNISKNNTFILSADYELVIKGYYSVPVYRLKYEDNTYSGYVEINKPITASSNVSDVLIYTSNGQANAEFNITNIQFEPGSIATNNEPYFHKTYTIPLNKPLRGLPNGVKDDLKTTKIGTGIFNAVTELHEANGLKYGINVLNQNVAGTNTSNSNINILCNKAICNMSSTHHENDIYIAANRNVVIFGSTDDTVETFNEKFAGAEYQYELTEPITEELTEEQLAVINSIKTEKGTTYFSNADNAEMEIEYYKDLQALFEKAVSE